MCLGGIKYSFEVQILYFSPQLEAVFILEQGGLTVAISTEPEHHAAGPEQERGGPWAKTVLGPCLGRVVSWCPITGLVLDAIGLNSLH